MMKLNLMEEIVCDLGLYAIVYTLTSKHLTDTS